MGKHHPAGIPQYLEHKKTGHARVKIDGHELWLGPHGSHASREKYDRVIAEWLANGRRLPPDYVSPSERTVSELIIEYLRFAEQEYSKDGQPTREYQNLRSPLRILQRLYGSTPVGSFGPRAIKTVRQALVDRHLRADERGKRPKPLSRGYVNESVNRIRRMFRWAVEQELAPAEVIQKLDAVSGLRHGKGGRETGKITVVPDAFIEAVRPFVSRQVWGLIQLQLCTGMRPGEAICLRGGDLNTGGKLWEINPAAHKTAHFGIDRLILVGPKGQAVLQPFLKPNLNAYLFSPQDSQEERFAALRAGRKSRVQPSQQNRSKAKPKRQPGEHYTVDSYRRSIHRACDLSDKEAKEERRKQGLEVHEGERLVPRWSPTAGTNRRCRDGSCRQHAFSGLRVLR